MRNDCYFEKYLLESGSTYIAKIVLHRPLDEGRLTVGVCETVCAYLRNIQFDEAYAAVILTGTGECFCMGARIETGQNSELFMKSFQTLHQQLDSLHKPIYAAVNGSTGGGGMTLIAAADQAFAAPKVQFLLPEICSGAAPCFALQKLHGQLPKKVLFKMASTGKAKTAEELETYGFITTAKDAEAAALEAAIAVSRHSMEAMQKICGILK